MNFKLLPMTELDLPAFKSDIQEAFQKGFEDVYGKTDDIILPEKILTVHSMLMVQQHTRLLLTVKWLAKCPVRILWGKRQNSVHVCGRDFFARAIIATFPFN